MPNRPQRRAAATRLGTMIGRFRLVDLEGSGGVGTVCRAIDTTLELRVAVKVLHPESRLNAEIKERFRREARVLSQLEHPNICQIHDFIEDELDEAIVLEGTTRDESQDNLLDLRSHIASFRGDLELEGELIEQRILLDQPDNQGRLLIRLANNLKSQDRLDEAEGFARQALEVAKAADLNGTEFAGTEVVVAYETLGYILFSAHRPGEAGLIFEEGHDFVSQRFGLNDYKNSTMLQGLVSLAMGEGRREDSVELARQVYEIRRNALGDDHPVAAVAASNYAARLGWAGRHDEAVQMGEFSLAVRRRVYGDEHVRVAFSLESLGWSKVGVGEVAEGRRMLEEALEMRLKIQGEVSNDLRLPLRLLGYLHRDQGRYELAERYFDRQLQLAIARESQGQANEGRGNALSNLATVYAQAGWTDRALKAYPELLETRVQEGGIDHRHTKEDAEKYVEYLDSINNQQKADRVRQEFQLQTSEESED